ncbi:MAG: hypothetical protein AAF066_19025, partial [Pseudomonadota bacterium]
RLAAPEPKSGASTNSATPAVRPLLAKPLPGCERKVVMSREISQGKKNCATPDISSGMLWLNEANENEQAHDIEK